MLDETDIERISRELPEIDSLQESVLGLSHGILPAIFPPQSGIPVASVCLEDTVNTLWEAVYALSEVFAHRIWYLEKTVPPNIMAAAVFGRYYADDAALRLYSAGEHLANGTIMILEIGDDELKPYKRKRERISQQSDVGHFLREKKVHHPVTEAVNKLVDSKEWCATIIYRNRWGHEQPPTVKGLGIVYKRKKRCKTSPNGKGYALELGGCDVPEYAVEDLVGFIKPATFQFTDALTSVVNFYAEILEDRRKRKIQRPDKR